MNGLILSFFSCDWVWVWVWVIEYVRSSKYGLNNVLINALCESLGHIVEVAHDINIEVSQGAAKGIQPLGKSKI